MRLIDADLFAAEMRKRQDACEGAMMVATDDDAPFSAFQHWAGVFAAFCEAKLVLDEMPTAGGWISVKDKMPPNDPNVRVLTYGNPVVTHWMFLPEPPEEEDV